MAVKKTTKKSKENKFKQLIGKLHLWFGLLIGFIIVVVSITGSLYVFKDEIENYNRKEVRFHQEHDIAKKKLLPLKEIENRINQQIKVEYPIHWVNIPLNKAESYRFYWYEHNDNAWNYFDEMVIYQVAYVNPYTGKVLQVYDEKNGFFQIVKMIHWSFLLKSEWGTYVVGIPVLIFIFMLISGVILWWPRNIAARKQRIWFRWKNVKNWKRKNYDLHNILGFYSSALSLIFAITGLFYAFMFVQSLMYFTFSGGKTALPDYSEFTTKDPIELRNDTTLDHVAATVREKYPDASSFNIDLGYEHMDDHEHPNFEVFIQHLPNNYYKYSSIIFDENSGKLLKIIDYKSKNFGEKVVYANYDIHVGSILGLPTKIIAYIISLMCASLPVTGFLVWWGRRKKKKPAVIQKK